MLSYYLLLAWHDARNISERVSSKGEIIKSPAREEIWAVVKRIKTKGIESVAISFLFSFLKFRNIDFKDATLVPSLICGTLGRVTR
ncbi:MAG: hydantoinase/oxoprolinase N-terminal domain-containing protein [Euryarchaeota archaeon]|nr:hydantoinase/oxoprolinase N-terminal domain-containing protein [Euryarchaeota archaeon]